MYKGTTRLLFCFEFSTCNAPFSSNLFNQDLAFVSIRKPLVTCKIKTRTSGRKEHIMGLTNIEKETIICFNEAGKATEVFTYRPSLIRQLDGLTEERPTEAMRVKANTEGGVTYTMPKTWVKIRPKRILTEEQKEKARLQAQHLHQNRI